MYLRKTLVELAHYQRVVTAEEPLALFVSTKFPVAVVRRRVHNLTTIQPTPPKSKTILVLDRMVARMKHRTITKRLARYSFDGVLLIVSIVVPLSVQAGVFPSFKDVGETPQVTEFNPTESLVDVTVLTAAQNAEPHDARGGSDVLAQDGVLVSTGPVGADEITASRTNGGEISVYVVRAGDSLSEIAAMFGVTSNTILWANDLPRASAIKPGDTLIILPIAGVRHVVKSGDTLSSIAKKYKGNAEEILSYNQLENNNDLAIGDTIVIPGGALHVESAPLSTKTAKKSSTIKNTATGGSSFSHPIPGGVKTQGIHGSNGVDFGAGIGTTIRAAAAGQVIVAKSTGWNGGYGNYIVIKHANGTQTLYAHLSRVDVGVGASVASGESIGASGNSGKSTGPHLHFEVRGGKNPF